MRTLMYAGKPLSDFHVVWDGSKEFDKPKKIANSYTIPYRNGNLIKSTESFENVSISYPCFIRENFEENYSELVNYLNSFDTYQRLESTEEPSIYRMAFLHSVITPKTSAFNQGGMFTITFDCMPQEWLKSGEAEMSIDMQTTTYTDPVEVDIEYDDALVDNAVLTLSPVQDLNGQEYPWVDKVGRNKLNLVNMAKTETVNGITFTLTDEGKIYMTGTATDTIVWFPFASVETIPNGIWKINGLPSNMTIGDYGFSVFKNDDQTEFYLYENNSEVTGTITNFGVWVYEGVTLNNVELKPMVRESTDTSDVWQPYEHTTNICPIYPANGTNHMPSGVDGTYTYAGVTVEAKNGVYTITGTATASSYITIPLAESVDLSPSTKQIAFMNTQNLNALQVGFVRDDTRIHYWGMTPINRIAREWTDSGNEVVNKIRISFSNGNVLNCVVSPMLMELGDEVTDFVPFRSVAVNQHGRNLLNVTATQKTTVGITFENDNGIVTANGTATGLANISLCGSNGVKLEAFTTYILSGCPSGGGDNTYQVDLRIANSVTTIYKGIVDRGNGITFTTDEAVTVYPFAFVRSGYTADNLTFKPMIRLASDTDDTFEPYQSNTYYSNLGQFVYGGTVDLVTGVLTVTHVIVDMGSLTWNRTTAYAHPVFYVQINAKGTKYEGAMSSAFRNISSSSIGAAGTFANVSSDGDFACSSNNAQIFVRYDQYTTPADFKTAVTGYTLVYPLATPQTYYLSAQDIALLQGKNYFTAEQPLSVTITEGTTLTNPSYMKARPIIKLNNAGTGTVKLNGDVVVRVTEAPSNVPIYIDCENMNCYSYDEDGNVVNENGNVTLPEGYIEMEKGNNRFTATGQLEPTMIPRWWRL